MNKKPRKKPVRSLYLCVYEGRFWRITKNGILNWGNTQNYLGEHFASIVTSGRIIHVIPLKSEANTRFKFNVISDPNCIYPGLEYYQKHNP